MSHIICSGFPSFVTTWNLIVPFFSSSIAELSRDWNFGTALDEKMEGDCSEGERAEEDDGEGGGGGGTRPESCITSIGAEFLRRFPGGPSFWGDSVLG